MPDRHDTYTVRNFDHWQVFCTCGWNGPKRGCRSYVEGDHLKHHDDVRQNVNDCPPLPGGTP